MNVPVQFAFGLHLHQPVGNFDHVFAQHLSVSVAWPAAGGEGGPGPALDPGGIATAAADPAIFLSPRSQG